MKVIHWNLEKKSANLTGIGRYENELFYQLKKNEIVEIERIYRMENKILGNIVFSWFLPHKFNKADIVHATFETFAPALYFNNINNFIITVYDLLPIRYPSMIKDVSLKIQWYLTPKALNKASKLISISEFTKKELIELLKIDKDMISVTHLGVDHSKYFPMNKDKCKEKFGLKKDIKYILIVSSNLLHKRMDIAKKVIKKIRNYDKNIEMLKIGYGESLDGDSIRNLGFISESDMPSLYNAADVYLHTSEYEGFGLPILEAMACGLPVVTSNKASIPEIVGDCGRMVDIDLKDCIDSFVENILDVIDKGVDEKALQRSWNFSWEKTANETLKVYKELLRLI